MSSFKTQAKAALMTTAAVLLVIYVMRKAPVIGPITGPFVDKAISG